VAYSRLQRGEGLEQAHYGPYALVLRTEPYADTYAPVLTNQANVANTLVITADRIKPLVTAGYYGTGTLREFTGILVSLGGNTVDLVIGMDATTAFLQEDTQGRYRLRLYQRFALRLKDQTAVIRLEFGQQQPVP
ncbi:MAG: encapsulin, partial [Gammaproteobacteria bacterium]